MPSGRLPKRPADLDESEDNSYGTEKAKLPRLRGSVDFSQVVKDRLQSYTRTGQACDRCKVRKIRCDRTPEGCSPCAQQNLECNVTDRVTGRAERRGYLQQLEREKEGMMTRLHDMEKLLEDKGIQVWRWQWTPPYGSSTPLDPNNDPSKDQWTQFFSLWVKDASRQAEKSLKDGCTTQQASSFETADPRTADARLGGIANGAPLSSINGTQQSILCTTIDITSSKPPDVDCRLPGVPENTQLYGKSLQSWVKVPKVNLPAIQFASHHQPNLNMAVKQGRFGSEVHIQPPSRSESTILDPMVNKTEKFGIRRAPSIEKAPFYNHSVTASTTAYPQMGDAGFTQSTFTPTSTPSSVQSSYLVGSANNYLYATSAGASAAAAQINKTVHTPPKNSPQVVTAAHNQYNSPHQTAVVQPYHHHHYQQQELTPAEWMNSYTGPANGILTAQQVSNCAKPCHPTMLTRPGD
ncbi:hypothetical protein F5883DRAFT_687778 [Diaporthe sp. PMI_573]|nr:hypothetical protein F5883DRAFT_687759 [Diaporthaceae sp. PMI_573]KAH8754833.1 hypothetical protein F5883DRAFT_687778 [Diaporthaceae sp. PMI_573]